MESTSQFSFASATVSWVTLIFANTSAVVAEMILYSRFMESRTRARAAVSVTSMRTLFKKLKVCSVAQKRPSLGRHFESLKKRLFLKLFYFRLNCTTKKSRHIDSTNSGRTFHPLAQFALKLCNGLNFKL